jgi:hypothetical protein
MGWNCNNSDLSLFLTLDNMPSQKWYLTLCFSFTVINHQDPKKSFSHTATHTFHNGSMDQGFQHVCRERFFEMRDPKKGFLKDNDLTVKIHIEVNIGEGGRARGDFIPNFLNSNNFLLGGGVLN